MREIVVAVPVDQAHVNMQSVARVLGKWFCHETSDITVLSRCSLDRSFEQYRVVTGQYRIVYVQQVDLKLRGRKFGYCRIGRNALGITMLVQVIQKRLDLLQVIRVIDLRSGLGPAYAGNARGFR